MSQIWQNSKTVKVVKRSLGSCQTLLSPYLLPFKFQPAVLSLCLKKGQRCLLNTCVGITWSEKIYHVLVMWFYWLSSECRNSIYFGQLAYIFANTINIFDSHNFFLNGHVFLNQLIFFNKHKKFFNWHKYFSIIIYFWKHQTYFSLAYIFSNCIWIA